MSGEINGDNVPSTRTGEAIRVDWAVEGTDKSGTIPADKVTSNISRIDIADDALAELASEEYDGKTIVFTVRGNFSSAKIAATLRYVAPAPTKRVVITDMSAVMVGGIPTINVCGTDLDGVAGYADDGVSRHLNAELFVNGTGKGTVEMRGPSGGDAVEYYFDEGVDVGDTVKVVLHIDPAKTEFDQNDVSREATVTE